MQTPELINQLKLCSEKGDCDKCLENSNFDKCMDDLMSLAADVLQAQMERIAELEAELDEASKIRNIRDEYATTARTIRLYLKDFCDPNLNYPDMIAEAARSAAAELEKYRWIPVKEQEPELNKRVLICREKEPGVLTVEQGHQEPGRWYKVFGARTRHISCWMPMPEPPEVS